MVYTTIRKVTTKTITCGRLRHCEAQTCVYENRDFKLSDTVVYRHNRFNTRQFHLLCWQRLFMVDRKGLEGFKFLIMEFTEELTKRDIDDMTKALAKYAPWIKEEYENGNESKTKST